MDAAKGKPFIPADSHRRVEGHSHSAAHWDAVSIVLQRDWCRSYCCSCVGNCCCYALQIVDMFAAATYLAGALEPWVALIVFVTIGSYIPLTIIVTEWRGNFRREMNRTENARSARVTDALLNW